MTRAMLKQETSNNRRSRYNEQIIDEYYLLVIYEIERGEPIEHIESMLKEYELKELYIECAGIKKGIDHIRFFALFELILRLCLDEQTDNLKLEYETR